MIMLWCSTKKKISFKNKEENPTFCVKPFCLPKTTANILKNTKKSKGSFVLVSHFDNVPGNSYCIGFLFVFSWLILPLTSIYLLFHLRCVIKNPNQKPKFYILWTFVIFIGLSVGLTSYMNVLQHVGPNPNYFLCECFQSFAVMGVFDNRQKRFWNVRTVVVGI